MWVEMKKIANIFFGGNHLIFQPFYTRKKGRFSSRFSLGESGFQRRLAGWFPDAMSHRTNGVTSLGSDSKVPANQLPTHLNKALDPFRELFLTEGRVKLRTGPKRFSGFYPGRKPGV